MPHVSQPLLPDVGVLALVPDHWSMVWQPRHHVLSRLTKYFPVVWRDPALEWWEALRGRRIRGAVDILETPWPGFTVYRPESWLPKLYRPDWLARLSTRQRLRKARSLLTQQGCRKIILYIWRPEYEGALDLVPHNMSCYHIDDEYTFSPVDLPTGDEELRLIQSADVVFIHSKALLEKKGKINPQTVFVPNGVDYDAYARPLGEPADLSPIPHPRIGYSGYLKKQLDWPLLLRLTAQHPEWSWVFVGSENHRAEIQRFLLELARRPNVHFLGGKLTPELPAYAQHFDVCIMPYRMDGYTKYIYPLKLHEYLAAGRPTAGTRIPSLEGFAEVVALASTDDEWSDAIENALRPAANQESQRASRQLVARHHDWNFLVHKIAMTLAQQLGESYASRLTQALATRRETPALVPHRAPART